jgi:hypothetical protein
MTTVCWRRSRTCFRVFVALLCTCAPALVAGDGATGSLLVDSDPPGASVYLDGRLVGDTPVMLPSLEAGVHRVRVVRLGYLENSRLVTVKAGAQATLRARLTDPAPHTAQGAALKIVVIEGEGAVNVIQQKTAVAPVIEVRDRNDQPVSGALVKFAIQKGKASFGGVRTLTVTTNGAGRATAAGLTASGKGALQIAASAAFQGQTAAATIAQTTVATAAEASSIASGASAASAGGGAGGGLSTTTLAIVGGAAAGATVTARNLLGNGDVYKGSFSGQIAARVTTQIGFCTAAGSQTGTIQVTLTSADADPVSGSGQVNATALPDAASSTCGGPMAPQPHGCCNPAPQVSGTRSNLVFTGSHPSGDGTSTWTYQFSGALNGSTITGTFTLTMSGPTVAGSATFPVTLERQ